MSTENPIMADIIEYLLEEPPLPLPPAERTRQWREQARAEGRPESKAVDAAISEAVSFLMSLQTEEPVLVDAKEIALVAHIVLVGHGYNRKASMQCVVDRLKPRSRHDHREKLPSRVLTTNDRVIEPPRGGQWRQKDIDLIRKLTGKTA